MAEGPRSHRPSRRYPEWPEAGGALLRSGRGWANTVLGVTPRAGDEAVANEPCQPVVLRALRLPSRAAQRATAIDD